MRFFVPFYVGLLFSAPAFASGGIDCLGEDGAVRFSVSAGVTRGMGGPVFAFRGELEILAQNVRDELRKTMFERQHLAQYWFDERELRLLLYRETEGEGPHGSVHLTIRTQTSDELAYGGQYSVTVFDMAGATAGEGKTVVLDGAVSCFVE